MSTVLNRNGSAQISHSQQARKPVVLASSQKSWGGGEVYLMTLASGLLKANWPVSLVAPPQSAIAGRAKALLPQMGLLESSCRNPVAQWQFRRWLKQHGAAILHCNDSKALTRMGIAAWGKPSLRVVSMRHTMFPIRSPGKYHRLSDRTICVSHAVASDCQERGLNPEQIRVVHSAIDPPHQDAAQTRHLRSELLESDEQKLVVAVGNLFACKGHATLVQAASLIGQRNASVRVVIAGEGDQRETLEQQIRSLGLVDRVRLLGFRNDANDLLAAADVIVHPALEEGLCLTVAAGMMLGKPIVATTAGGLREVLGIDPRIGDGGGPYARTIAPADAQALADGVLAALDTVSDQSSLDAAKRFALENFSADKMIARTVDVYEELLRR